VAEVLQSSQKFNPPPSATTNPLKMEKHHIYFVYGKKSNYKRQNSSECCINRIQQTNVYVIY